MAETKVVFRIACSVVLCLAGAARASALGVASQRVATGLSSPVCIASQPGDTTRLFICEQFAGNIRILNLSTGTVNATPFITIPGVTQSSEQGLLGLAFDPNYATNGFFYVNYTANGGGAAGHTEVDRYTAIGPPATATTADLTTKAVVLTFNQPETNHNGGWLGFGKDGYLYISAGDGGGGYDVHGTIGNGQDRTVLLGKIMRINVSTLPYTIPSDNPFATSGTFRKEIWAFGVRNPWRCSFDRSTGDLWVGDVGQDTREEIDFNPAGVGGRNYGWRPREGLIQDPNYPSETPVTPATDPVVDYDHSIGVNAIIGGYVYRGSAIPGIQGVYIHADYGSGRFWSFIYNGTTMSNFQEVTSEINPTHAIGNPTAFGEDGAGELYVTNYSGGEIYKIVSSLKITTASLSAGTVGINYSKTLAASGGSPPYSWSVISGSLPTGLGLSAAGVLSGTPSGNGSFTFTVQVQDSSTAVASKQFTVVINAAPVIQTATPISPQGNIATAYTLTFTASGGTAPLAWSVSSGTPPAGLTLSGAGVLSGTPTTAGTSTFGVKVQDANGASNTKTFSLTINNVLTVATTSPMPAGDAGTAYSNTLTAAGGTSPYTWSVSGGALPAGFSLSAAGVLSGTTAAVGTYTFTAKVTDNIAATASQSLSLTINPALAIQTASVPGGNISAPYSFSLVASGGTSPLTWSNTGSLPAGVLLSSSGVLSGTPTAAGSFAFTAKVTDAAGAGVSRALSLVISNAPSIYSAPLLTGNIGIAYSYNVQSGGSPAPSFSLINSPPAGMTIIPLTGAIAWTPTAAGVYSVTVQAANGVLPNATQTFAVTVTDYGLVARPNSPPYLNMPSLSTGAIPATLSGTGTFSNTATLTPSASMIPYTVNSPLWSDGAIKTRWISIPNGQTITFAPTGEWVFPSGTVFVKHFELGPDDTNPAIRTRLETRLLVVDANGQVYGVTYKWNAAQTDADLLATSLSEVETINTGSGSRTQTWYYPSRSDCLTCHNSNANYVLGVKTRQLNGPFTYPATNVTDNQLRALNHVGLFNTALDETQIPGYAQLVRVDNTTATLDLRVRSYLDANCAQCHRPGGAPANFDARFDTALASQNLLNGLINNNLGVANASVLARGNLSRSMALLRVNTVGANQMPPIARNTIDAAAVSGISAWVESFAAAPSGLNAVAASDTQVDLSWIGNGDNETAFNVERTLDGVTWTSAESVAPPLLDAQDGGLTPATSYAYRVRAVVASGDTALSNTAPVVTLSSGGGGGGGGSGTPPVLMKVSHVKGNMKFSVSGHDTASVSGVIPGLPAGFNPNGASLGLNIAGAVVNFTLDKHGRAHTKQGSFVLQLKLKRDRKTHLTTFPGGDAPFRAQLHNGAWAAIWTGIGIDPAKSVKNQPLALTVNVAFQNQTYTAAINALYTGRGGKTGLFSK